MIFNLRCERKPPAFVCCPQVRIVIPERLLQDFDSPQVKGFRLFELALSEKRRQWKRHTGNYTCQVSSLAPLTPFEIVSSGQSSGFLLRLHLAPE